MRFFQYFINVGQKIICITFCSLESAQLSDEYVQLQLCTMLHPGY